jgi:hypothetical protein
LGFVPWHHLVFVKDFKAVKLCLVLNDLYTPIEGQKLGICHHLIIMQRNTKCYKCTEKKMKTFHNFEDKDQSQCSQNLTYFHNPCDQGISLQDMFAKVNKKKSLFFYRKK